MTTKRPDIYNLLCVGIGGTGVISASNILAWAALNGNYKVRTAETHGMAQRGGSVSSYLRFGDKVEGPLIPKGSLNTVLSFELVEALRNVSFANSATTFVVSTNTQISPSVLISRKVKVDLDKCVGCGNCISYCYPNHLKTAVNPPYTYVPDSPVSIYKGKRGEIALCTGCGKCVNEKICPFDAMKVKMELYYPTIEEVYENLKRISDKIYFINAPKLALESGNARTQNTVMIGFLSGLNILPIDEEVLSKTVLDKVPPKARDANKNAYEMGRNAALNYNEEEIVKSFTNKNKK